jgi:carboxyl-terminal processing protease
MKKMVFILLVICSRTAAAQPADSLRPILDSALLIMQEQALHREETDWEALRKRIYQHTKGISNIDSLLNQFPLLFEWIHDFHGGIQTGNTFISWKEGKPASKSSPALDSAIKKAPGLLTRRWGDIGYYRIPGGSTKNLAFVTQMLADSLCSLQPATVKGWIIDLRLNTGGNIWFMLPPLASLIGDGITGGIKHADGKPDTKAWIAAGKVYGNGQVYQVPNPGCTLPGPHVPVVVLVGPKTASSGEGVMLAFKGRPNTIIMGEPTAGLITSNNSFQLRPGITMILATGYMQDRSGQFYTAALHPDVLIPEGDNFFDLANDHKIIKALEWLQKK